MFKKEKKHFKKKLKEVQRAIWDLEFKRFKTFSVREEVRHQYDESKAKRDSVKQKIEEENKKDKKNVGEIAKLEDTIVELDRDIERAKEKMKALDIEVKGSSPTQELPEGFQGLNDQIEAFHELDGLYKLYIDKL